MKDSSTGGAFLVLGASSAIGAAVVERLVDTGAPVHGSYRSEGARSDLASKLRTEPLQADLADFEQVERTVQTVVEREGRLDGVTCCAGSLVLKPAHLTSLEEFDETLRSNLYSAFHTVKASAPVMQRKGGGSIVLVSSAAAQTGLPNHEAIAAAKAGVIGLARSAAASYAPRGVRVNCVAPGMVRSAMTEALLSDETRRTASADMHPLGRIGTPDDVAALVTWLLDPAHDWMTGQVLGIDGGLAALRPRQKVRAGAAR